jgi:hypothetical protein
MRPLRKLDQTYRADPRLSLDFGIGQFAYRLYGTPNTIDAKARQPGRPSGVIRVGPLARSLKRQDGQIWEV